jgi:hypothetical protein
VAACTYSAYAYRISVAVDADAVLASITIGIERYAAAPAQTIRQPSGAATCRGQGRSGRANRSELRLLGRRPDTGAEVVLR